MKKVIYLVLMLFVLISVVQNSFADSCINCKKKFCTTIKAFGYKETICEPGLYSSCEAANAVNPDCNVDPICQSLKITEPLYYTMADAWQNAYNMGAFSSRGECESLAKKGKQGVDYICGITGNAYCKAINWAAKEENLCFCKQEINYSKNTPKPPPLKIVPGALYRYYNSGNGDHFYTTNSNELGNGRAGYTYEGHAGYVETSQKAGTVPLYRYHNPGNGDHFYTTNWNELGNGRSGFNYEAIQCYVYTSQETGTAPFHRYFNTVNGDHFYTTNWGELGSGKGAYKYEGVACYIKTNP